MCNKGSFTANVKKWAEINSKCFWLVVCEYILKVSQPECCYILYGTKPISISIETVSCLLWILEDGKVTVSYVISIECGVRLVLTYFMQYLIFERICYNYVYRRYFDTLCREQLR